MIIGGGWCWYWHLVVDDIIYSAALAIKISPGEIRRTTGVCLEMSFSYWIICGRDLSLICTDSVSVAHHPSVPDLPKQVSPVWLTFFHMEWMGIEWSWEPPLSSDRLNTISRKLLMVVCRAEMTSKITESTPVVNKSCHLTRMRTQFWICRDILVVFFARGQVICGSPYPSSSSSSSTTRVNYSTCVGGRQLNVTVPLISNQSTYF